MRWKVIESTNIAGCAYSRKAKMLIIEFHSGKRYAYKNVSETIYRRFLRASSQGEYFNREIKDNPAYPWVQIKTDDASPAEPSLEDALQRSLDHLRSK